MCFVAASAMVSCSDDNNENGTGSASIVGTWGCVHSYEHFWGIQNGESYDNDRTDKYVGNVINFKEDGTYTSSRDFGPFDDKGGTWMIDENRLIVDRHNCDILTLNNSSLKVKYLWNDSYEEDEYHDEYTLEFKRQ